MKTFTGLACALALAACGGNDSTGMNAADASAYRTAALQVSDSVTSYGTATTTMATVGDCTAAVQQHVAQVQPALERMGQLAGPVDGMMQSAGQMMGADVECGVGVMQQEMEQHRAAACASGDMATNRAEAQRHVGVMQQLTEHMQMRAEELNTMMAAGAGMGSSGGMMHGGGTVAAPADGGWTMPNGGVMSWDDTMPGCTFVNGAFQQNGSTTTTGGGVAVAGSQP